MKKTALNLKKNPKILNLLSSLQETLLHVLLASVITVSVMTFPLDFIEAPLYDLRQYLSAKPEVDDRIVIVTIDDQTINQLNDLNPLPLSYHLKSGRKIRRTRRKGRGISGRLQ